MIGNIYDRHGFTAQDKFRYGGEGGVSTEGTITSLARTLLADTTTVEMRETLGLSTTQAAADALPSVTSQIDFTTAEPGSPSTADRYINTTTGTSSGTSQSVTANHIYEWDGTTWIETTPTEGAWTTNETTNQSLIYSGSVWVNLGAYILHNSASDLQGGQSAQYYHLTLAQHTAVSTIVTAGHAAAMNQGLATTNIASFAGLGLSGDLLFLDGADQILIDLSEQKIALGHIAPSHSIDVKKTGGDIGFVGETTTSGVVGGIFIGIGANTSVTATNENTTGAYLTLRNKNTTVNNYTAISHSDSGGDLTARALFVNTSHSNHTADFVLALRDSGDSTPVEKMRLSSEGNLTLDGTVDGRDIATDGTKLDGIESSADVTDATNVAAAGAVMESDTTTENMSFVVDEDDMSSNSATKIPTQQSVKAYVDANAGAAGAVMETDYNAHGVLVANSNNNPVNLTINTNTVLGRLTGNISALSGSEIRTIINVEDGADVTDATNVAAAGAVMESDTTTASMSFVVDEDTMSSDSATKVPTQQSVKAYVDNTSVLKSTYNANTILAATTDNTPAALTVGASTFVGRKATGNIAAMTPAEAHTLLQGVAVTQTFLAGTGTTTSVQNLTTSDLNKYITDDGASEQVYVRLPTAVQGYVISFYVEDGQGLNIRPNSSDTITYQGSQSAAGDLGSLSSSSSGDFVTLLAVNDSSWVATNSYGSWFTT